MSIEDIRFTETDTNTVKGEVIAAYERMAGRTLAASDPVRLFLESLASVIAHQRALIDFTGKMNLLAYARGDYLDHIGLLVGTERLPAAAATAHFEIKLSALRPDSVVIPKGTRIGTAEQVLFALDADTIIKAGGLTARVSGTCTEKGGVGNGYAAGTIRDIVDPIPYVTSITNTTVSEGGANAEDDDAFRRRIQEAPEHFSTAGPNTAYAYFAKKASPLIADVKCTSPAPGVVNIYPLLTAGQLPGEEILNAVKAVLSDDSVRPLTDKVEVRSPSGVSYDVNLTYYIDEENAARATEIKAAVERTVDDYILWQRARIGRDVNPTELYYRIRGAGAKRAVITAPTFTAVGETSIATVRGKTVAYGGLEDG
ncbi:baseplate assembly protein [Selenomonas sp. F0473]|uniref:baseplate assembly protein n=1 Tax=Selenomonas sp. F0473 TaxID=999423 RepID=UPI0025ECE5F7|nr:baseplate J/gp47 family protein [Selenomonas sp. F0473]